MSDTLKSTRSGVASWLKAPKQDWGIATGAYYYTGPGPSSTGPLHFQIFTQEAVVSVPTGTTPGQEAVVHDDVAQVLESTNIHHQRPKGKNKYDVVDSC